MSCLTVNTQVNKQVVKIHNQNDLERVKDPETQRAEDGKVDSTRTLSATRRASCVHYPDLTSNEKLSDVVLKIILKQVEDNNKMIELTVDELKEVIKTICKCDEVFIDYDEPAADAVTCCGSSSIRFSGTSSGIEIVYKADVKKILLKYNNRTQLEDFKMHYNELKIITEDYKININEVTKKP